MSLVYMKGSLLENNDYKKYPKILVHEYERIFTMIEDGQTSGVLLQIKDMFEILLKLPVLIAMSEIYHREEWQEEDKKLLYFLVHKPLSLGNWNEIANRLSKNKTISPDIKQLIKKIAKMYNTYDLVLWRNENIGHGALKLDTDIDFIEDIKEKINLITEYLNDEIVNNIYSNLKISVENSYSAKANESDLLTVQHIIIKNKKIRMIPYIIIENNQIFFYDTYYSRKNKTQILNYTHGVKKDAHIEIHRKVVNLYEKLQRDRDLYYDLDYEDEATLDDVAYFQIERVILEELSKERDIVKPTYLEKWIKNCLENESGIFLLQMERGMGKSTFSRGLDELDDNSIKLTDTNVRVYYFNDTYRSKATTFATDVSNVLKRGKKAKNTSLNYEVDALEGEIEGIHTGLKNKKEAMVNLLNICRKKRRKKLLLILDGVDEIPANEIKEIFEFIPSKEELPRGIYILITARVHNELEDYTKKQLDGIDFTDKLNVVKESEDNIEVLKKYIMKYILKIYEKNMNAQDEDRIEKILNLCENRFLFLSSLKEIINSKGDFNIDEILKGQEEIFLYYIKMLENYYGEKYFYHIKRLLSILAIAYEPLTIREIAYLIGEEKRTFKLLGFLKDIKAFLKVERSNRESNVISINHKRLISTIRKYYIKEIEDVILAWYDMFSSIDENEIRDISSPIYDGEFYLASNILYHIKFYLKVCKPGESFYLDYGDFQKIFIILSNNLFSNSIKEYQLDRGIIGFNHILDLKEFLDSELIAKTYMNIGIYRSMKNEFGNSINDFLMASEYIRYKMPKDDISNKELLANNYYNLAISYKSIWQLKEALKYANKGLSILEKLYKRNKLLTHRLLLEIYIEKATILELSDRLEDAYKTINKVVDYVKELQENNLLESERLLAFTYSKRGNMRSKMNDYQNAKEDYEKSTDILETLEEEDDVKTTELIYQYLHFGILYDRCEEYEKAIDYYNRALEKIEKLEQEQVVVNLSLKLNLYYNRGETYFKLEKYDKAINNFNQAIKGLDDMKENNISENITRYEYIDAYMNRAVAYLNQEEYELALKDINYFIEVKEELMGNLISEKADINIQTLIKAYYNKAEILNQLDRKNEAIENYKKSLELLKNKKINKKPMNEEIAFLVNRIKDILENN